MSTVKFWINKSFTKNVVTDGLNSISKTYLTFFKQAESECDLDAKCKTPNTAKEAARFFESDEEEQQQIRPNQESQTFKINKELEKEILIFSEILADIEKLKTFDSTSDFWKQNKSKIPKLYDLSKILLNISASSAFIERYFSICGFVCDRRRLNMNDELIIMRCMLKVNLAILEEMNVMAN